MWDILTYLLLIVLIAGALIAAALVARSTLNGTSPLDGFFGPKPDRRLDVVEHAAVDSRRRLVLVRRDNVEHLIMTGGPVDVVIETGIAQRAPARPEAALRPEPVEPQPVFSRPARTFGQATAGEK
jgi:flagellar protein FliO/FliZ